MIAAASGGGEGATLLIGEAHHRFFNGLQLIVAETNGILRHIRDPDTRARLAALQDRVALLAEINRCLAGPFYPQSISGFALARLCAGLATSFNRPDAIVAVSVSGDVESPHTCRAVLLLVGELMTNALKHCGLGDPLCVQILLVSTDQNCRLMVRSNTAGQHTTDHPRMAAELARTAGGRLEVSIGESEYAVMAEIPAYESR